MGKFGGPHKLCIIRTLEFVYFSFFGGGHAMCAPMGKFGSPHKLCMNIGISIFFLFWGHSAKWVGSPHKLCIIRTLE